MTTEQRRKRKGDDNMGGRGGVRRTDNDTFKLETPVDLAEARDYFVERLDDGTSLRALLQAYKTRGDDAGVRLRGEPLDVEVQRLVNAWTRARTQRYDATWLVLFDALAGDLLVVAPTQATTSAQFLVGSLDELHSSVGLHVPRFSPTTSTDDDDDDGDGDIGVDVTTVDSNAAQYDLQVAWRRFAASSRQPADLGVLVQLIERFHLQRLESSVDDIEQYRFGTRSLWEVIRQELEHVDLTPRINADGTSDVGGALLYFNAEDGQFIVTRQSTASTTLLLLLFSTRDLLWTFEFQRRFPRHAQPYYLVALGDARKFKDSGDARLVTFNGRLLSRHIADAYPLVMRAYEARPHVVLYHPLECEFELIAPQPSFAALPLDAWRRYRRSVDLYDAIEMSAETISAYVAGLLPAASPTLAESGLLSGVGDEERALRDDVDAAMDMSGVARESVAEVLRTSVPAVGCPRTDAGELLWLTGLIESEARLNGRSAESVLRSFNVLRLARDSVASRVLQYLVEKHRLSVGEEARRDALLERTVALRTAVDRLALKAWTQSATSTNWPRYANVETLYAAGVGRYQGVAEFLRQHANAPLAQPTTDATTTVASVASRFRADLLRGTQTSVDRVTPALLVCLARFTAQVERAYVEESVVATEFDLAHDDCHLDMVEDLLAAPPPGGNTYLFFDGAPLRDVVRAERAKHAAGGAAGTALLVLLNRTSRTIDVARAGNASRIDVWRRVERDYRDFILLRAPWPAPRIRRHPPTLMRDNGASASPPPLVGALPLDYSSDGNGELRESSSSTLDAAVVDENSIEQRVRRGEYGSFAAGTHVAQYVLDAVNRELPPLGFASTGWRELYRVALQLYRAVASADGEPGRPVLENWRDAVLAALQPDSASRAEFSALAERLRARAATLRRETASLMTPALDVELLLYEVLEDARQRLEEMPLDFVPGANDVRRRFPLPKALHYTYTEFYRALPVLKFPILLDKLEDANAVDMLLDSVFSLALNRAQERVEDGVAMRVAGVVRAVVDRMRRMPERHFDLTNLSVFGGGGGDALDAALVELLRFTQSSAAMRKFGVRDAPRFFVDGVDVVELQRQALALLPERQRQTATLYVVKARDTRCALVAVPAGSAYDATVMSTAGERLHLPLFSNRTHQSFMLFNNSVGDIE